MIRHSFFLVVHISFYGIFHFFLQFKFKFNTLKIQQRRTTVGLVNIQRGREGTLGGLLHQSPKFYNNVSLFVALTTLGTFIEFLLVVNLVHCSNLQPLIVFQISGNFVLSSGMYNNLSCIVLSLQIPGQSYHGANIYIWAYLLIHLWGAVVLTTTSHSHIHLCN